MHELWGERKCWTYLINWKFVKWDQWVGREWSLMEILGTEGDEEGIRVLLFYFKYFKIGLS